MSRPQPVPRKPGLSKGKFRESGGKVKKES